MDQTQSKVIAKILGLTEQEYQELLGDFRENFEQLVLDQNQSNSAQDAQDALQKSGLDEQVKELAALTNRRLVAIAESATQPAKATAAQQKATDIDKAATVLLDGLATRDETRKGAFANTISRLQLDVSEGGQGARADRTLAELAQQTDVITNGAAAARELSTDSSLKGFFARGLIGNPYAEGVEELTGVNRNLRSTFDGLNASAKGSFDLALAKDTPVSELTTRFNTEISKANADANALQERLLIAPEQAQLQSNAIGAEIQQATTAGNIISKRFDIDTAARDRDNAISQFQFSTDNALTAQQLALGAQLGRQATTFIPTNADGSLYNTTTYAARNDANNFTIGANNADRSTRQLGFDLATGSFDAQAANARRAQDEAFLAYQRQQTRTADAGNNQIRANNVIRSGAQLGFDTATGAFDADAANAKIAADDAYTVYQRTQQKTSDAINNRLGANNVTVSDGKLRVAQATGALDPAVQKAKQASDEAYIEYTRQVSKSRAALEGIGSNGVIDPKIAATASKAYAKEQSTRYVNSGVAYQIALNQEKNNQARLNNSDTQLAIDTKVVNAKAKTIAQELGNAEAQILLLEAEIKVASDKVAITQEQQEGLTEAQRLEQQNTLIELREKNALLSDVRYQRARMIAGIQGAEVQAAQAEQENSFLQDKQVQVQKLETRKLAQQELHRQAVANGTPEQIAYANRELSNANMRIEVESKSLAAELAYVTSPTYLSDTLEQRSAKINLIRKQNVVALAEAEEAIRNRPAISQLNDQQLKLEAKKVANELGVVDNKELNNLKTAATKASYEATIDAQQKRVDEGTARADDIAILNDSYNKLLRKTGANRLAADVKKFDPKSPEAAILREFAANGNKLAGNPYLIQAKLDRFVSAEPSGFTMYSQVTKELQTIASEVGVGKKLTDNSAIINASIARLMVGPAKLKIDSPSKTNGIMDVPTKQLVVPALPVGVREAVQSVTNWDEGSMADKLSGLKAFYTAEAERQQSLGNSAGPILPIVAKKVADAMVSVMDTKADLGRFDLLGLPRYTKLNYNAAVSDIDLTDGKVSADVATRDRNFFENAISNLGVVVAGDTTVQFNVLDQTSVLQLIKLGHID